MCRWVADDPTCRLKATIVAKTCHGEDDPYMLVLVAIAELLEQEMVPLFARKRLLALANLYDCAQDPIYEKYVHMHWYKASRLSLKTLLHHKHRTISLDSLIASWIQDISRDIPTSSYGKALKDLFYYPWHSSLKMDRMRKYFVATVVPPYPDLSEKSGCPTNVFMPCRSTYFTKI